MTMHSPVNDDIRSAHAPYIHRACPSCGGAGSIAEVRSSRRAEALSFDTLRPFWSGLFKEKIFFSYHRCDNCSLMFAPDFFTDTQLETLYADMAPNMDMVPSDALEATQRGYFDSAAAACDLTGAYLEIGPDIGYVVRHAAREGHFDHFWLFEPNRAVHGTLAEATGGLPHSINADMTNLSQVPDGSVGLAVMVHVLDHLLDPVAMLDQIRMKLKSDGVLVIVTHNEGSVLRRVMGNRWPPFCLQHPEIYNPRSMTRLLENAGYGSSVVRRSKNYFPIAFMARQAAYTVGLTLKNIPLPKTAIGLKLGNIITLARR